MLEKLFPNEYLDSVYEVGADKLKKLNIDTVIFDIDNTLVPYFIKEPNDKLIRYFRRLKKSGIKIGILSNNKEKRVKHFCSQIDDVVYQCKAGKPGTRGLKRIIQTLQSNTENTVIIGDQIFTDVWCGNKLNIYTILVKQVSQKDEWITAVKRGLEKKIIKIYLKKRDIK